MSERKVLNKYFPPDFDPALIPRRKMPKDQQHKVRLMTPFSMRCETCGEYIYKGKKFNARKETVAGETYYSILIFRFYIRCPRCAAEITFKTDPKNADYVAEHGATRNFEPWRDEDAATQEKQEEKLLAEANNPLKALENRTLDSKRELEIMEGLDEIRTRNARLERMDVSTLLDKMVETYDSDEDEKVAQEVFKAKRQREEVEKADALVSDETKEVIAANHVKALLHTSGLGSNSWKKSKSVKPKESTIKGFGVVSKVIKIKAKSEVKAPILISNEVSLVGDYSDSDESG